MYVSGKLEYVTGIDESFHVRILIHKYLFSWALPTYILPLPPMGPSPVHLLFGGKSPDIRPWISLAPVMHDISTAVRAPLSHKFHSHSQNQQPLLKGIDTSA